MNNIKYKSLLDLRKRSREKMIQTHNTNINQYNTIILNNIIYNEKSRIVAIFKEFLIHDDISEFLKRLILLIQIL